MPGTRRKRPPFGVHALACVQRPDTLCFLRWPDPHDILFENRSISRRPDPPGSVRLFPIPPAAQTPTTPPRSYEHDGDSRFDTQRITSLEPDRSAGSSAARKQNRRLGRRRIAYRLCRALRFSPSVHRGSAAGCNLHSGRTRCIDHPRHHRSLHQSRHRYPHLLSPFVATTGPEMDGGKPRERYHGHSINRPCDTICHRQQIPQCDLRSKSPLIPAEA